MYRYFAVAVTSSALGSKGYLGGHPYHASGMLVGVRMCACLCNIGPFAEGRPHMWSEGALRRWQQSESACWS